VELVRVGEPHVRRQRGKWVVRIEGYDPASGKIKVRQAGTFDTKRAALAHQRSLLDGPVGTDGETLAEFLEKVWLPSKEARVERATLDQYTWAVRRHVVPLIGAARLRDLSPELLDEWVAALVATEASGRPRLGSTSARTVRKVLSMALEEATQRGRLARNPVALTQPPRRDRSYHQMSWTLQEAQRFLASVQGHRLAAAFQLCLVTGLRRGELLALRWDDVDLTSTQLAVRRQLALERGRPVLKQLKTEHAERIVTFGRSTAAALRSHQRRQEEERRAAGVAWEDQGLVFTTETGRWIEPGNFCRVMTRLGAC
jgi:integrase